MKAIRITLLGIMAMLSVKVNAALPDNFVYLKDIDPTIIQDMRYSTNNNFVGRQIRGYETSQCILTRHAALALAKVQETLKRYSLGLKVYDCYRPQRAVDDFVAWSKDPSDLKMKKEYYPTINKEDAFKLGYIATKSGHTRGSTVDLTIVHLGSFLRQGKEVDMGAHYDLFDESSHVLAANINVKALRNRLFLHNVMEQAGFEPTEVEWWHFTLKNEPYPDTYFDFPVR